MHKALVWPLAAEEYKQTSDNKKPVIQACHPMYMPVMPALEMLRQEDQEAQK